MGLRLTQMVLPRCLTSSQVTIIPASLCLIIRTNLNTVPHRNECSHSDRRLSCALGSHGQVSILVDVPHREGRNKN